MKPYTHEALSSAKSLQFRICRFQEHSNFILRLCNPQVNRWPSQQGQLIKGNKSD